MPTPGAIEKNAVNGLVSMLAELTGFDVVASQATLTLPLAGTVVVTGTTTVTSITPARIGRKISLLVPGALQFTDGGNLNLAGNFVGNGTGEQDCLELVYDGTNWTERGRSLN